MLNGSSTLGGVWNEIPVGANCAEAVLAQLITSPVDYSGEMAVGVLAQAGFANRGCDASAAERIGQPIYALGNPHDYISLDGPAWDLQNFDAAAIVPGAPFQLVPAAPVVPVVPVAAPLGLTGQQIVDAVNAHTDAAIEGVKQQIDQVVKNAEVSLAKIAPLLLTGATNASGGATTVGGFDVGAIVTELTGLFAKKA